jgi:hypothetical protein
VSEQNILNPTVASQLNPTYSIPIQDPEIIAMWQARSGKDFSRTLAARGRAFSLHWDKIDFTTYLTLRQWWSQYEKGYFSFADYDDSGAGTRYYTGRFVGPPTHERAGFNQVNVTAQFVELPGRPMFAYPSNWGVDSIFLDESDDAGAQLVKLTGSGWVLQSPQGLSHNNASYTSATTNDIAEWLYYGYGFRVWALKASTRGIAEVSLDGTVLGTYDQFNAANVNSAAIFTQLNVPLGQHRVKLRVTGTKNAGSSAFNIDADAIEVMR